MRGEPRREERGGREVGERRHEVCEHICHGAYVFVYAGSRKEERKAA